MTKEQKPRRKRSVADFDDREDDFILADLDSMLHDVEPAPVPLNHILDDEDVIDRLLVGTSYIINDELVVEADEPNRAVIDDMSLTGQNEEFEELVPEPPECQKQHKNQAKATRLKNHQVETDIDEITPAKDAIDKLLVNAGFDEPDNTDKESQTLVVDDISLTDDFKDEKEYVIDLEKLAEPDRQVEIDDISMDIHHVNDSEKIPDANKINTRSLVKSRINDNGANKIKDRIPASRVIDDIESNNEYSDFKQPVNHPVQRTGETVTIERLANTIAPAATFEANEDSDSADAVQIESKYPDNQTNANLNEKNIITSDKDISGPEKSKLSLDDAAAEVFLVKEGISKPGKQQQPFSELNYPEEQIEPKINIASMIKQKSIKSEQDFIKKQLQDTENISNKIPTITYLSLGFAVAAFISSIVMGVLLSKIQTKVSKLNDLVSILEEDMSGMAEKDSDLEVNNEDSYSEKLTPKTNDSGELTENQSLSSSDISEHKISAHNPRISKDNKSVENQPAKSLFPEQKEPSVKDKTESAKNKATQTPNPGGWSINLTAYEDHNYAKSRAAKYLQKKIPVKVVTVDMNNSTWYRLKVDGFKNKEDADAYATKIKKSLNLSSVTVVNK